MERAYRSQMVQEGVEMILDGIGIDRFESETVDTSKRVAKMWKEITVGYDEPKFKLTTFPTTYTGIVAKSSIPFFSICKHHTVFYVGKIDFAYMPKREKLGISKIIRLLQHYSKQLTSQEELTDFLVDKFMNLVKCKGCFIRLTALHFCEGLRGIRVPNVPTITNAVRGIFNRNNSLKDEAEKMWDKGVELSSSWR